MKRNSSKNPRKKAGFTLVELVVVIAVLAILAGVGVVAYNGYITYAQKGKDRQLVGEVMHAIELADYADPGLFGEDGGAMVVISGEAVDASGNGGIQTVGGLKGTEILKTALTDALGDLGSYSLSYDSWNGTADMSVFAGLGDSGTQVAAYLEAIGDDGAASFAGDIDELWQAVQDTLGKISEEAPELAQVYMDRVVTFSTREGNVEYILENWKTQREIRNPSGQSGGDYLGPSHSRNYAFYMYAKNHCADWDDTMQKEIDELLNLRGAIDYFSSGATQYPLKDPRWTNLINSYKEEPAGGKSQAEIDALAYLGMMEAAKAVGDKYRDPSTGKVSDSVYLSAFEGYVGMVGNVLSKQVNLDEIKTLANQVTGNVVVINATKKNGTMVFSVSPKDASPREEEVIEEVKYTKNNEIFEFTSGTPNMTSSQTVILQPGESVTITVLCENKSKLNLASYGEPVCPEGLTVSVSGDNVTITSDGTPISNGQIVFSKTTTFPKPGGTSTVTINVVVK